MKKDSPKSRPRAETTMPWTVKIGLIFLLLLGACEDSQSARTNSQPQEDSLQGNISIWRELPIGLSETQSGEFGEIIRSRLEEFMRLNPGIKVTLKLMPSGESVAPFLKQAERGAGPNLLWLSSTSEIAQLIESRNLQVLDNYQVDLSSFRPEALQQVRYQDQLYGIPTNLETQVLCYNRDKVKELPNTLSELIAQAREGYSVGLHSGFAEALWGTGIFSGRLFDGVGHFTAGKDWANLRSSSAIRYTVGLTVALVALSKVYAGLRQGGWGVIRANVAHKGEGADKIKDLTNFFEFEVIFYQVFNVMP
jgi:maltose-binding protein MalE